MKNYMESEDCDLKNKMVFSLHRAVRVMPKQC